MNHQVIPNTDFLTRRKRIQISRPGYRFPSVTVFLPFDPKMESKHKIKHSLSKVLKIASSQLRLKYPGEMSELVIQKLKFITDNLNFSTHKKSLAIFVSPVFEKVYYLNMDLEEKIIVNQALQIRDIVDHKRSPNRYHILLLSKKISRIFFGSANGFIDISFESFINKMNNAADFTGHPDSHNSSKGKGASITDFLYHLDKTLETILQYDRLPVVVMGNTGLFMQFERITDNNENIIEFIKGDFERYSFADIQEMLNIHPFNWQQKREKYLLTQIKKALDRNQLITGIEQIGYEVLKSGRRILILEKEFVIDSQGEKNEELFGPIVQKYNKFSNVKNQVDEIIEKILVSGGDVELVNKSVLENYGPIALVRTL